MSVVPLRRVARVVPGGTPTPDPENWGGGVAWATPVDLGRVDGSELSTTERTLTTRGLISGSKSVPANSLMLSTRAPIGYIARTASAMAFNQGCKGLVLSPRVDPRFLSYQLWAARDELQSLGTGSTFLELSTESILAFAVHVPKAEVQRRIADFLDDQVARIDEIIRLREKQLVQLASRLIAEAHAAVTGVGQSDRSLTSLNWSEGLPASWPVARLSTIARIGTGHTPSRSVKAYWDDTEIPWLTTGDVWRLRMDELDTLYDTAIRISELGLANSAAVIHPPGTVALSRTASAGYSCVMGVAMATSQDFVVWRPSDYLVPEFLLWCLRVMRGDLLGRLAMGSTHKTIYFPDLEMLRIPLPPLSYQAEAADRCHIAMDAIGKLRTEMRAQITLLHERKRSLITAAVTGEFDVSTASGRGVA